MIFAWSHNEEEYHELGNFNSYEEAYEAAYLCPDVREYDRVWIAKRVDIDSTRFIPDIGDWLMEELADRAGDEYGELADSWPSAPREEVEVLNETLRAVTKTWLKANSPVNFWTVEGIREYTFASC